MFTEYIYLSAPVDELYRRVQQRNRPGEIITKEYLQELQDLYDIFKEDNKPVGEFDMDKYM